ncbi:MAG: 3-deoxy-D-manno-octulosonic acid transferase [Nitrospirae bacterium]|nr:3-deoxy-D-manno-octulosonic acid transferase [Nitrospirota bacterium]
MYLIYSLLYSVVLLFLAPFEYLKRPRDLRSRWLRERTGFLSPSPAKGHPSPVWVHAVSVGEVISAVPFIKELKERYPSIPLVLSTVTDTGQKVACERVSDLAQIIYLPFDLVHIVRRVLKRIRPALFITVETELWPNIFRTFKQEGIPILVLNGRLSENSFKGYRRIKFFIRDVLACVELFCMQDRVYEERIRELGVEGNKVRVTGNFKFDTRPAEKLPEWANSLGHPVALAGSTHEGEEELMASVFERLRKDFPEMNLILAPRHPERFRKVEDMIHSLGLPCVKRSEIGAVNVEQGTIKGRIVILDTMGELASSYGISDVAIMGGSFYKVGGHNPLEPAFWGKPVVCGPHMENFPFIQDFYIGSGAIKTDAEGLYEVIKELLRSPAKRKAMGERAKALYNEKAGAVGRAVEILKGYLDPQLPLAKEKPLS